MSKGIPKHGGSQKHLNKGGNEGNKYGAGNKRPRGKAHGFGSVPEEIRTKAATLIAIGDVSYTEIAKQCEIDETTLYGWRKEEWFIKKVAAALDHLRQTVMKEGIADRVERVKRLQKRWDGINKVFQERGDDPIHSSHPGWTTGLLCHEQRSIGSGDLASVVDIYKVDVGTIKEEREIAKQAAQELGQWTEKIQQSYDLSNLTDEELETLERISSKLAPKS